MLMLHSRHDEWLVESRCDTEKEIVDEDGLPDECIEDDLRLWGCLWAPNASLEDDLDSQGRRTGVEA
ncbi:hypothetical protein Scep_001904 [Stephania cephalantha]|uniref:Uncharacterized protein n=1 Tax=Stephania cephalantha TaxID=152367 RepID=A0AAP0LAA4_9MAGN